MRWFNLVVPVMDLAACVAALAQTPTYNRGRTPSEEEIRAWDIAIGPDGKELPPGSGTAQDGAKIYAQKCAVCHGRTGEGGPFKALVGGQGSATCAVAPHCLRLSGCKLDCSMTFTLFCDT